MWQADGAERFACKNINGHAYTEMYEPGRNWSFVTMGTKPRHPLARPLFQLVTQLAVPADPSTEYWQGKVSEAVGKIATEYGTSGVTFTSLGSAGLVPAEGK